MHYLTSNGEVGIIERQRDVAIEFIQLKEVTPTFKKPVATLKAPRPLDTPPPTSAPEKMAVTNPNMNIEAFALPALSSALSVEGFDFALAPGNSDAIPMIQIRPQHPFRATELGIEGWVKVEFTITTLGTTKDVHVVESQPAFVFDQAAIHAVSRWKFKPRTVNGKATQSEVSQHIDFTLDDN